MSAKTRLKSNSKGVKIKGSTHFVNTPKGFDHFLVWCGKREKTGNVVLEAFSVFAIDLENLENPEVVARIKTGNLVGAMVEGIPAVGGSSPNSIVATDKFVFVSNGSNDNISVISTDQDTVIHTIYPTWTSQNQTGF